MESVTERDEGWYEHETFLARIALYDGIENANQPWITTLLDVGYNGVMILNRGEKGANVEWHPCSKVNRFDSEKRFEIGALQAR